MKTLFLVILSLLTASLCLAEPYSREKHFGGWIDEDGDGQDTRQEVLIEESLIPVTFGSRGKVVFGLWYCEYTGRWFTNPSELDIDHRIPLAEAYESGAEHWPKERRVEYANCLSDLEHLVAVSAGSNRSKGAKDPAKWLPPIERDEYKRKWADIKNRWGLCADPAEIEALNPYAVEPCP